MIWLDQKYIQLVGYRLRNFKQKNNTLWNFSCPFCGDSHSNKRKARGYIYERDNKFEYHCHKCGISYKFSNFLKNLDQSLYDEYLIEMVGEKKAIDRKVIVDKKVLHIDSKQSLGILKKVSQLQYNHPCKMYVDSRLIPTTFHHKLYWAPKFMRWVNTMLPDKFDTESLKYDEGRLIIPFFDKEKNMFGFQGRSLIKDSKCKYVTILLKEDFPKIYGLDTVDDSRRYYILEGPIDSFYVDNSVASAGGDLRSVIRYLSKENAVIIYDNEPRSIHTIEKLRKAINQGLSVCIWPSKLTDKDISDMINNGMEKDKIKSIIDDNTFSGLNATLQLNSWAKVREYIL